MLHQAKDNSVFQILVCPASKVSGGVGSWGHNYLGGDRTRTADITGYYMIYEIKQKKSYKTEECYLLGLPLLGEWIGIVHWLVVSNCVVHHLFCKYI